jgi:hypothetical protein
MKSTAVLVIAFFGFSLLATDPPQVAPAATLVDSSPAYTADSRSPTSFRFEVTLAAGMVSERPAGRLLVVLGRQPRPEARLTIGRTGMDSPPVFGIDVKPFHPGTGAVVDNSATSFPLPSLSSVPAGVYYAQAVLDTNRDLKSPNAPGNFYSVPLKVTIDPSKGGFVNLELTQRLPPDELPKDTDYVKYVKLPSGLLSRFHSRPMYLRAAVILPGDYNRESSRRYPLRVHIGGYGTRFSQAGSMMAEGSGFRRAWLDDKNPRMILLHLDGAGPYGDPYQVNSANNGPYGDAITQELIPYVEQRFRCVGQPFARVLDGGSTGGWVSLALQVSYPDFFNGAWSQCPDPLDFRAFELIDIYKDENAYVNRYGFERPSARDVSGEVRFTVRHECQIENVMGQNGCWALSGKDWGAWNATFGPRGPDSRPLPLWDPKTGKIERSAVSHWKQYDLRLALEQNWKTLGPKLHGKIHIWVGDADNYFLNNAVHLLDTFLSKADPPYGGKIVYGPGQGHTSGWSEKQIMAEMAGAIERAKRHD